MLEQILENAGTRPLDDSEHTTLKAAVMMAHCDCSLVKKVWVQENARSATSMRWSFGVVIRDGYFDSQTGGGHIRSNTNTSLCPAIDGHASQNRFQLIEGNDTDKIEYDNVHGGASNNTIYRSNGL